MTKRACAFTGCLKLSDDGGSRCLEHRAKLDAARKGRHTARRKAQGGDGAAARLRRQVNSAGHSTCAHCGHVYYAHDLEIDHVVPLLGASMHGYALGADVAGNVQILCNVCHKQKSIGEQRRR
jgi:5-methylcytosine-specific restriction endonuclease McrA